MKRALMFVVPALLVLSISVASAQAPQQKELKQMKLPANINVKQTCLPPEQFSDGSLLFTSDTSSILGVQHFFEPEGDEACRIFIKRTGCEEQDLIRVPKGHDALGCSTISLLLLTKSNTPVKMITTPENLLKSISVSKF